MYKFWTKEKRFRFCYLAFFIIFVGTVFSTQLGETDDLPKSNELPSSTYATTHGNMSSGMQRIGRYFLSTVDAHSHALATAHWDRSGFYLVYAKTYKDPFAPWWRVVSTIEDKDTNYFRAGCRAIANVDHKYFLIPEDDITYFAESRVWDNTGAKDGETNWGGLVFEDEHHGR